MYIFGLAVITLLWTGVVNGKEISEVEGLASKPTRCTYERAYDMYGAHCVGLKLTKLPNLKSGIEVNHVIDFFFLCI